MVGDVLFNSEAHVIDFVNLKDLPTQSSKMLIKVGYTYVRSYTTGHRAFAVCQRHTAKAGLHSAKCLPCVTHGKPPTAYNGWQSDYLPCVGSRAHGKGFAVCHIGTRQTFSEKNKKKWSAATTSTSTAATVSAAASGGEGPDPPQHLEGGEEAGTRSARPSLTKGEQWEHPAVCVPKSTTRSLTAKLAVSSKRLNGVGTGARRWRWTSGRRRGGPRAP